MAEAKVEFINDYGSAVFSSDRDMMVLLAKNSSPAGTVFVAQGETDTYAFGKPDASQAATFGWQMFDEQGNLLFDAINFGKMAKPVGFMYDVLTSGSGSTKTKTQTFPAGRKYAVAALIQPAAFEVRSERLTVQGASGYFYFLDDLELTLSVSGTTVTTTIKRFEDTNPKGGPSAVPFDSAPGSPSYRAVVLDVTHF